MEASIFLNEKTINMDCPYCNRAMTINESNFSGTKSIAGFKSRLNIGTRTESLDILWMLCPNEECKKVILKVQRGGVAFNTNNFGQIVFNNIGDNVVDEANIKAWMLMPETKGKVFPDYIPTALRSDYEEAYAIAELSPKASATLARRCLQGMIRDFWSIKEDTLFEAINALNGKIDDKLWKAIDAVRKIGNIGAHMERDINLIIDVDSGEAIQLLNLIERLFKLWYINREEQEQMFASIVQIKDKKENARNKKS